jgi:hypothetical protein
VEIADHDWTHWLPLLCPIGFFAFGIWFVVKVVRRILGGSARGVRTHIGDDGFWIYSPDETRGRSISYTAVVGGADQPGVIASPGLAG